MSLPQLNDVNANAYFNSISTNGVEYTNLVNELVNDFIGALEMRFTLTQAQIEFIDSYEQFQKQTVICAMNVAATYLNTETNITPVEMLISGIQEEPPAQTPQKKSKKIKVEVGAKTNVQTGETTLSGGLVFECEL